VFAKFLAVILEMQLTITVIAKNGAANNTKLKGIYIDNSTQHTSWAMNIRSPSFAKEMMMPLALYHISEGQFQRLSLGTFIVLYCVSLYTHHIQTSLVLHAIPSGQVRVSRPKPSLAPIGSRGRSGLLPQQPQHASPAVTLSTDRCQLMLEIIRKLYVIDLILLKGVNTHQMTITEAV